MSDMAVELALRDVMKSVDGLAASVDTWWENMPDYQERRKFALLQATATLYNSGIALACLENGTDPGDAQIVRKAVSLATQILDEIERREDQGEP